MLHARIVYDLDEIGRTMFRLDQSATIYQDRKDANDDEVVVR